MAGYPRVVVVGGGFGGLNAVKELRRRPVQVTLIDRRNYHLFRPLLYQLAMAGLSAGDIASPLRAIFAGSANVCTLLAEVTDIDVNQRRVIFADGRSEPYDYLVVSTGARYDYFGHDEWAPYAPNLDTIESALEVRRRLLTAYEEAELATDPMRRQAWMTFAVVGGGPTGVELAGAIGELARHTLKANFCEIDPAQTQVLLIEALDRILLGFPPHLSTAAERSLTDLGVTVRTRCQVIDITEEALLIQNDNGIERIPCRTTLWAAGVRATRLGLVLHQRTGVEIDRRGRVKVMPDLSLPGRPEIFVIGDMTYFEQDGKPLLGVAPVAIQQGRHTARQVLRRLEGQPTVPFRYQDRGNMATIGRAAAVADLHRIHLSGFIAWLAWLLVHVINLIGFRNRISVLWHWVWNYLTYSRSERLIVGAAPPLASGRPVAAEPAQFQVQYNPVPARKPNSDAKQGQPLAQGVKEE